MTLDWNEHPEAREEFLDAHDRYLGIEDRRLGDEFADVVEAARKPPILAVQRFPMS